MRQDSVPQLPRVINAARLRTGPAPECSGFAPVRPYRIPLSEVVLALPFQLLPLDEDWADEETPLASEVLR